MFQQCELLIPVLHNSISKTEAFLFHCCPTVNYTIPLLLKSIRTDRHESLIKLAFDYILSDVECVVRKTVNKSSLYVRQYNFKALIKWMICISYKLCFVWKFIVTRLSTTWKLDYKRKATCRHSPRNKKNCELSLDWRAQNLCINSEITSPVLTIHGQLEVREQ